MPDLLHPKSGQGTSLPPRPSSSTKLWMTLVVLVVVGFIVGGVGLGALWIGKTMTTSLADVKVEVTKRIEPPKTTPAVVTQREPAAKPVASSSQPLLRIVSTQPASPAALKVGERMTVVIEYENPGPGSVQIWARPWTAGRKTSGYGAHGSGGYAPGKGTIEGWFTLRAPGEIDEVGVEMVEARDRKVLASVKLPVRGVWSGEALPLEPAAKVPAAKPPTVTALDRDGAFGFPQKEAKVLCDTDELRFSVWNNGEHFLAQAILWHDSEATVGVRNGGHQSRDLSILHFDRGGELDPSPMADRKYNLESSLMMPALRYQARASNGWTPAKDDSKARGAIRYETMPNGKKARVDTFAIPLGELGGAPGKTIRLAYWAMSANPDFVVNSTSFKPASATHYSYSIPVDKYNECLLGTGHDFDVNQLPNGNTDRPSGGATAARPVQSVQPRPPEGPPEGETLDIKFTAMDGREVDLAKMKGKVVLIDFWATWCGPCVAELPHVLDAYSKFHDKGFEIVGISFDSDRAKLERMMTEKQMTWPQFFDGTGWKNEFGQRYGIRGIPTMWLVNKDGKLASKNGRRDLAAQVERLLAE